MQHGVLIRGGGIAARCCAHLLNRSGVPVSHESVDRAKLPAIMIGETTQKLFQDVFETPALFDGFPKITKRIVAWGESTQARILPHAAVIAAEEVLLERLSPANSVSSARAHTWTVTTSRQSAEARAEQHFGTRIAEIVPVELTETCDAEACWIESLQRGWLFMLPTSGGSAWLLGVGDRIEDLLGASRLVSREIARLSGPMVQFEAHPRIKWPLCGEGWLVCGSAALGFDPLCGDGSGHSIREAILAAGVIAAAERGGSVEELLTHYQTRLLAGFRRHLRTCTEFYGTGGASNWWLEQLHSAQQGLRWCDGELNGEAAFLYRLRGFALERI